MENCEFITLHHTGSGYVVQCKQCRSFQFAFGNLMVNLQQGELEVLIRYIDKLKDQYEKADPELKQIQIPTDSSRIALLLSGSELHQLGDMLQQALVMSQVYETLKFTN